MLCKNKFNKIATNFFTEQYNQSKKLAIFRFDLVQLTFTEQHLPQSAALETQLEKNLVTLLFEPWTAQGEARKLALC